MEKIRNYYAVKVTGGQEINVALLIEERIKTNNITDVYSIVVPPNLKGYVIIEATGSHIVRTLISGIRHVRGLAHGLVPKDEIIKMISKKGIIIQFKSGDLVEIVSGPFRGMQAQVVRVEENKGEVVLNILESAFPLQVTLPIDQVKPTKKV
jgi:transcriptional antiterminator NusG